MALRKLVEDYEKASGNTIDLSIVPFVALRQKEVAAITSGAVPELMEDADFSFTPLNAWDDKLLDVSDIIETQKSQYSEIVLLGRHLYNSVKKERSYYGVPMKMASTTSLGTKPWANHAVAVVAAALARCGRASAPAARRPAEPRNTERRLNFFIALSSRCAPKRPSYSVGDRCRFLAAT